MTQMYQHKTHWVMKIESICLHIQVEELWSDYLK